MRIAVYIKGKKEICYVPKQVAESGVVHLAIFPKPSSFSYAEYSVEKRFVNKVTVYATGKYTEEGLMIFREKKKKGE